MVSNLRRGCQRPFCSYHPTHNLPPTHAARLQDVLVVTAPGSGAEIIPFLKTWVNLPMAIGFTVLYTKVRGPGQ